MSDTDKPSPAPQPNETPETGPLGRPRPPRERPARTGGPIPSLEHEQSYGFGKKIDAFDAEMERELEEAMGGMSSKDLLEEPAGQRRGKPAAPPGGKPGAHKGRVMSVRGKDVFIDMPGGRTQGLLPIQQFPEGPPAIGTEVEVYIEGYDRDGVLILTREGAAVEADWSSVAPNMIVEARVTGTNKGGLSVDVNGIRGFMPISQIELFRVENLEGYVNQRLRCLVAEVDREERNLVVSRRALLDRERQDNRDKLWGQLAEGQVREGVVRSVRDFGAFVDLGGVDGLLHVSEMSWQRVQDPTTLLAPGQTVKVVILKIDPEHKKLSLGMKQLLSNPWEEAVANYPIGDVVRGKVSKVMEFGAFVELEPGIEGLIHVSELSTQRVRKPGDVVKVGQEIQVKVLNVDPAQRRISLSLKAAQVKDAAEAAEEEAEEEAPARPARPRTTPLRGGVGQREIPTPGPEEDAGEE
jgi:small subunit ribosomal protein S1